MINQWTERVCKGSKCAAEKPSDGNAPADGHRMWTAIRQLVDVNAQVRPSPRPACVATGACCSRLLWVPAESLSTALLGCTSRTLECLSMNQWLFLMAPRHAQMGNLASSMSEETSLRRKYEAPLSMAILKRSTSLGTRPHADLSDASRAKRGGFVRWAVPVLSGFSIAQHETQ